MTLFAGRSRLVTHVGIVFDRNEELGLERFLTFVHVDRHGRPLQQGVFINAVDPEEIRLKEMVKPLHPGALP